MEKLKKIDFIHIFILILPFIDFMTSICTWNGFGISIGMILKGIFLVYACIYLLKNTHHRKIFLFLSLYFIVFMAQLITSHMNLSLEVTNIIKIFYLPILILFFSVYENEHITKKTLTVVLLFYLLLYLVPFFLGLGHNISEIYPNKELYLSYFYIGNEFANIILLLLIVAFGYLIESNSYLLKGIFAICILITLLLLSTKTFYLGIALIFIYYSFINRKKIKLLIKKNYLKTLLGIAVLLGVIAISIPKVDLIQNIKTSLEYYQVDSMGSLVTYENIDHVIFSSRLTFLKNVNQEYNNGTSLEKMLGLGKEKVDAIKNVEIDIFDIFYSIGILGTAFYLIFFFYVLKNIHLQKNYMFAFLLLLLISCFTGHVLITPFTSTWLAVLVLVSKNDKGKMKKDILLVTNMYPNKQYPHYGIFVKNTYELLKENGFAIDLVSIKKEDTKIKKIIAYLQFYVKSFHKSIWNNYDYIYVHFISHSTLGVYLPYLCSKNTKLVLNAHGNDVVPDTELDLKNVKKSKIYLKGADIVISPSKYFANILKSEYQVPKNKIVVYPSGGVDTTKFKKIEKKKAKKEEKLDEKTKYIGFVSRIEKDKGYDTYVKAIYELKQKKKIKDIKFLLIGSGNEEPILNELIKKYKLQKDIIRKPLVSQNELVNIYNSLEAFVYPTRRKSESLGLTGLEAMACETLVIGSNLYGPSDYLEDNKNSFTFEPTDDKALATKIEDVLQMKVREKNKITKEARKKSEEYSFDNTKDILLKVFKR